MTPWRFYRLPFNVVILNHAVCGRPEGPAVRYCVCPLLSFVVIPSEAASRPTRDCCFLSFVFFFTLSSRTAHCADALRDLLFAWLSSSPFSLRCHPERGAFCRRGTCCSLLPFPTSSPPSSFQITPKARWKFPASTSASPPIPAPPSG